MVDQVLDTQRNVLENKSVSPANNSEHGELDRDIAIAREYQDVAQLVVLTKGKELFQTTKDPSALTRPDEQILWSIGAVDNVPEMDHTENNSGKPLLEVPAGTGIKLPHVRIDTQGDVENISAALQDTGNKDSKVLPVVTIVGRKDGVFQCTIADIAGVHDVPEQELIDAFLIAKRNKLGDSLSAEQKTLIDRYVLSIVDPKSRALPAKGEDGHDAAVLQLKEAVKTLPIVSSENLIDTYADKKRAEIEAAVREEQGGTESEELVQAAVAKKVSENASLARVLELQKKLQEKSHPTAAELTSYVKDLCLIQTEEYASVEAQIKTLEEQLAQKKAEASTEDHSGLEKQVADLKVQAEYMKLATKVALDDKNQIGTLCQKVQSGELSTADISQFREFIGNGDLKTLGEVVKNNLPPELQAELQDADKEHDGKLSKDLKDNPLLWIALLIGGVGSLVVVSGAMQGSRGG